ncbi:MAG: hypothetical protein JXL67_02325, partial [Calditrichaeota bacterium]|nr:hypothetical protein [Calditrichota bacterium]
DIQNFSCLFTTSSYIDFAESMGDSTATYPLQFIWTRGGKNYYVLQPFDFRKDSLNRQQIMEKIQNTKNQFYGFFLDWMSFLIMSPLDDVPPAADVHFKKDSVFVNYATVEEGITAEVEKIFLPSGRLVRVEVKTGNQKIINYPLYEEHGGKWLCMGWDTQIYIDDQVTSGLSTRIELRDIAGYRFPSRADVVVQTIEKPEDKFLSIIFLKDYQINQALQELPLPASATDSLAADRQRE